MGNIDLVVSALAVHHLDGAGKADLFARIAARRRSGGRFVLGDVVVPDDPADVVTLIDGVYDQLDRRPGPMACRRRLSAEGVWARQDPLRDRRRSAVLMPPSGDDRWCARSSSEAFGHVDWPPRQTCRGLLLPGDLSLDVARVRSLLTDHRPATCPGLHRHKIEIL